MKLTEFFSKSLDVSIEKNKNKKIDKDELFWFMLDNDVLHKKYFFPVAKKLDKDGECGPALILEMFMPMVKEGCRQFYKDKKLTEKLGKLFSQELREELCNMLYRHYKDGVKSKKYNIGN